VGGILLSFLLKKSFTPYPSHTFIVKHFRTEHKPRLQKKVLRIGKKVVATLTKPATL
jgi:hypothetical protein